MKKIPLKYKALAIELGYSFTITRFNDFYYSKGLVPDDLLVNPKWLIFKDSVIRYIKHKLQFHFEKDIWEQYGDRLLLLALEPAKRLCAVINKAITVGMPISGITKCK